MPEGPGRPAGADGGSDGSGPAAWTPPAREPWAERLIQVGRNLGDDGRSLVSLAEDDLLRAAEQATGLSSWGDAGFREPLSVLCRALEEEARLHLLGRLFARSEVQRSLQARLRAIDWRRRHPEVDAERVERPVFVTGLGRSGTTLLHELLALDPRNRVPLLWELLQPVPPPEADGAAADPRVEAAEREITLMDAAVPALTAMHENAGDRPNECIFLFAHELLSDVFTGEFHVPSYTLHLARADVAPAYATHRRLLQLLQSRRRGSRWVLKAPSHLSQLPALFAEYPDARVVWAHRDPLQVVGSLCNLMATLHWMRSDSVDFGGIAAAMAVGLPFLGGRVMRQRDEGLVPDARIHDVVYADLVRDPLGCVRGLYASWGEELAPDAERAMRERLRAGGRCRRVHEYRFETTGLDAAAMRAGVAPYMERYGIPVEVEA